MREHIKSYAPVLLFVFLIVLLLTGACGGPPANSIVGRWEDDQFSGVMIEFFNDGTLTFGAFGVTHNGTYQIIDSDTIRIDGNGLPGLASSQEVDYSLTSDKLTLSVGGISIIEAHRTDAAFSSGEDKMNDIFNNIVSNV